MEALADLSIATIRRAMARPLPGPRGQMRMTPSYRLDPDMYRRHSHDCRRGAVLFLLYPWQGELHTVLTVRRPDLPDHPGQVAFPGGARDGNETVVQTALREAHEEVGVDPARVEILGRLTHIYIPPSHFCIQIVVGYTPERPPWQPNPREIALLLEPPLRHFCDRANWDEEWRLFQGQMHRIPFFRIGEHKVWGATAMTIAEFITLLEDEMARPLVQ